MAPTEFSKVALSCASGSFLYKEDNKACFLGKAKDKNNWCQQLMCTNVMFSLDNACMNPENEDGKIKSKLGLGFTRRQKHEAPNCY